MDCEKKLREALVDVNTDYEVTRWIEQTFPELKEESEDERIRGKIIATIHLYYGEPLEDEAKEMIAWLEKQVEQKTTIEIKTPEESLGIDSDTYNKIVDECVYGEQNPAEPKFKTGDWVVIKKLGHFPNDSDELNVLTNYVLNKKQKSLKNRVQPKQEWNEEDEKYSSYICAALECYYRLREDRSNTNGQEDLDKAKNWIYNRLKSLRPQSHWKPSDEQMTQLKKYCPDNRPLTSLYEQLKKLKE